MKWKNAASDHLPRTSGKFLVSYKGVYHLAYFHKVLEKFEVLETPGRIILHAPYHHLYWTEIETRQNAPRPGSFRILIADDDMDDQELMKIGLEKAMDNLDIFTVNNGAHTLDYIFKRGQCGDVEHTPDLLLLDLNMPLVDGFKVLSEIRRHEHLNTMPVYVITTSRHIEDWNRALELGANGFYSKGSKLEEIHHVMKEVCLQCFGEIVAR